MSSTFNDLRTAVQNTPFQLVKMVKNLTDRLQRTKKFAELGPYYVVGMYGFLNDVGPRKFTNNIRESKNFPTWLEADDFARQNNMKWWCILKCSYIDLDLDIPSRIVEIIAERNDDEQRNGNK